MRLRTKLTLTIAVASILPTIAATIVSREIIQRRSRDEFSKLLHDGQIEVLSQYKSLQHSVIKAVERLADSEDQFIGPILLALAKGELRDDIFRNLAHISTRVMEERGLQVLTVLGPDGKIFATGHFPGRIGDIDPKHPGVSMPSKNNEFMIIEERLLQRGNPVTCLTLQVKRIVSSSLGDHLIILGGVRLDDSFIRMLRLREGTEVFIQEPNGKQIAGPDDWGRYQHYPHNIIPLKGINGDVIAKIIIAVPDLRLRRSLSDINHIAFFIILSSLCLSIMMGFFAGGKISHPLQELLESAGAVSKGNLEQHLSIKSNDEIGDLVDAFNHMTSELKHSKERLVAVERIAAWREIARRIAHEIKNPLFPIQTSIETLRKVFERNHPDFKEIFIESTTVILEEVERLKNIATEFSRFARMPKPIFTPCNIKEILINVTNLYKTETIEINTNINTVLTEIMADKEQLVQVFSNLVQNARDAVSNRPNPMIQLTATLEKSWIVISVRDNGCGFNEEIIEDLFKPYFTTKAKKGGTGLGLAIVNQIVIDHGGRVDAHRGYPCGAIFIVKLPLLPPKNAFIDASL